MKKLKSNKRASRASVGGIGIPRLVDVHVGSRLRLRRTLLGISQEKLGDAVGLTFQQIQKYERGANRISASRLYEFSRILNVTPTYFFDEMGQSTKATGGRHLTNKKFTEYSAGQKSDPLLRSETTQLVRNYYKITNRKIRKSLYGLVKNIAVSDDS